MPELLDKPISIRFEGAVVEHLKRVARYEAFERDTDVTVADIIRESVLQVYPMPKQVYPMPKDAGTTVEDAD